MAASKRALFALPSLPVLQLVLLVAASALAGRSQVKALSDGMWRELLQGEWMVEL